MALNENIPLEVLQQFLIESNPQSLGYAPDAFNAPPIDLSQTTNVQNVTQQSTEVVNRCTMVSLDFASSYNGNANPNRSYLLIQNTGAGTMYIMVAGQAVSGSGLQIAAGGYWEPLVVPINTFSVVGTGTVLEGTTI